MTIIHDGDIDDGTERLDVLVVSGPDTAPLRRCLASVRTHLGHATVRVWINQGAGLPPVEQLVAEHPDVDFTPSEEDLGYAAAVNRLAVGADAHADLLLLAPDVELLGPLTATRAALRDPAVAVVSPTLAETDPEGDVRAWDVARRPATLLRALADRAGRAQGRRGTRLDDRYASAPTAVDGHLARGCLLVARAAWDDVGPFNDRRHLLSGEGVEWQCAARERGWRLLLVDEPQVRHHRDGGLELGRPEHRVRDLALVESAFTLGVRGNAGTGMLLAGADLVIGRIRRSRREARARDHAVPYARHGVVITTPQLGIGGAERQRALLANELVGRGHPVTLVCLHDLGHLQRILDPRVRVVLRPWWQPFLDVPGDGLVLVSGTTAIELAFAAAFRHGTGVGTRRRWLVAAHNPPASGPTYSDLLARIIRRSDGVIALSEGHWRDLTREQHLHTRHWSVPNGVELHPDRGYRPGRPLRVGFLGRIVEHKNPHLLVEALAQLPDLEWRVDLFGSGPDEERLQATTPAAVADRVHWRGRTPGPGAALAEMDVLCLPSRLEAFPLVLLEAMACGVPTMASAVCAVPDMLDHGRAGIVVPESTVQAWVDALRPVLTDPESLGKIARTGWERVESRYTVSAMTDGYERVMDEVLSR